MFLRADWEFPLVILPPAGINSLTSEATGANVTSAIHECRCEVDSGLFVHLLSRDQLDLAGLLATACAFNYAAEYGGEPAPMLSVPMIITPALWVLGGIPSTKSHYCPEPSGL